jgi:hypothetical protein
VPLSIIGGMICVGLLMSLSACQTRPEPCNCDRAVQEMTRYTLLYHEALEDKGNLRQQLKACQERK